MWGDGWWGMALVRGRLVLGGYGCRLEGRIGTGTRVLYVYKGTADRSGKKV